MTIAQLAGLSDDRTRVATGDIGSQAPLYTPAYAGMTIAQLAGLSDDRSRVATGDSGSQAPLYTPWHTRARDAGLPLDLHCR